MKVLLLIVMVGFVGLSRGSPISTQARSPTGSKTVIAQMFEWDWDSIASECTSFLGPAGYGFVQASPAQEHITGTQWWTDYQPVSYTLTSKRGNETQYQNMIKTCHAAGVKIIADTLFNHMAGADSGTGVAGSTFTHYDYPGIYQNADFHHCGGEPDDNIVNYDNRTEVQECQLEGLADLDTEAEYVRSTLAAYGNHLLGLGVDGLRLDAAKHIAATSLANITSRLTGSPYITCETIWGSGEPIQPSEYVGIGDAQEFRYTTALQNAFTDTGISGLKDLDDQGWVDSDKANVFVANHDTERNGNTLNYNSAHNTYVLATIFSLAHPYGTPTVLSSYEFSTTDDGAPNSGTGTCSGTGGENGWLCQHRWVAISGMVGFRNNAGSAALTDWVAPSSQQIAFGRESAGFVAINNEDTSWTTTFSTSLPAGAYCDVINGAASNGTCSGTVYTVASDGTFSATINAYDAIALHTGALGTATSVTTVAVTFSENATTSWGENIFVAGSLSQLGSWNADDAIALSSTDYPDWTVVIELPVDTTFEYKFIRKASDGSVAWESDPNRSASTTSSAALALSDSWR
ncbi:carbohydrate-binding module family 20 protein [Neolentinus lepideus HHB14362 ss-1]|uniref:Alpha-amylase n=1 Tax=Neolentinus lepideus HHB14362 ss-1 TaxID=1314782 RepID=A0A165P365_9AGAM|nr:carbohydrate-binding module family 20 protein [Neolentinus lepideus HHB14362 ss-1]